MVKHALSITLFCCLPACTFIEPLTASETHFPQSFSTNGEQSVAPQWWYSFGDQQLNQWVKLGLNNNQSLVATRAKLQASQANWRQARSGLYPQVDTGLRRQYTDNDGSSSHQWQFSLGARYEVDLWGRIDAQVKSADFQWQSQQAALQAQANTVAANISQYWYGWVTGQQTQQLLHDQILRANNALQSIEGRFRRGQASITDVWRQRQLLESLQGQFIQAETSTELNWHQLLLWTGETPFTPTVTTEQTLPTLPPLPNTGIPLQQLQQRPDVRQAWANVEAANATVAAAIANRYPRLSLSADINGSSDRTADFLDDWLTNLVTNLTLPLIDGGNRKAQVNKSRAQLDEQLANFQQTLLEASKEIEDALLQEAQQQRFMNSLQQQLALSKQTEKLEQQRYSKGVSDFLDLLQAQQNRLQLEQQWLGAQLQQIEFRIALYRALSHGDFAAL